MAATQKSLCAIPADPIEFPADANTLDYARSEDAKCPIRHMREHFIFPTRASLKKKALDGRLPGGFFFFFFFFLSLFLVPCPSKL